MAWPRDGVTAAAAVALLALQLSPRQARADIPDGGPGGACLVDSDCQYCGWVCSASRGNICVPASEGDPGHCTTKFECPCAGQTCSSGVCSPKAQPACWCNGDCPAGSVCDQLLFTCHPASAIFCGRGYNGYDYGAPDTGPACGCNGICGREGSKLVCQPQVDTLPSSCASDLDCGSCYQKMACIAGACVSSNEAGWCSDSRDVLAAAADAGSGNGGNGAKGGCSAAGASCLPGVVLLLIVWAMGPRRTRRGLSA